MIPDSRTRDICERLRRWCHAVDAESAQDLMDEAADEIERLRQSDRPQPIKPAEATRATHDAQTEGSLQSGGTITDAEREAIEWFASLSWGEVVQDGTHAATLRKLLERTK